MASKLKNCLLKKYAKRGLTCSSPGNFIQKEAVVS